MENYIFNSFYLNVGDNHQLYCWEAGNKNGVPFIYLHGGPGGQTSIKDLSFFDLENSRVILFDQRGCGKSKPRFYLEENNTSNLIEDIEKIRKKLKIDKWVVFGGSWGSCLGLLYAQKYPNSVMGLILRGVFLGEKEDWEWTYQSGASFYYPKEFEEFTSILNDYQKENIIQSYFELLRSDDLNIVKKASYLWAKWEELMLYIVPKEVDSDFECNYQISLIENHYAINNSFLRQKNQIINNMHLIEDIKTYIVHGRYDLICKPSSAYEIHKRMKNSDLKFVQLAAHSSREKAIQQFLFEATNKFLK